MDNYPDLHAINSSICEQYHSYLQKFCRSVTRMNQENFMRMMRVFIDLWNSDIHAKLTEFA